MVDVIYTVSGETATTDTTPEYMTAYGGAGAIDILLDRDWET